MERIGQTLRQYWGYDSFRPLQAEAMRAVLHGHDSLVVLPTGGGKSLCFQAPALCLPGLAIVVSPLISLMKDQVDALADCGIPAACVNSSLAPDQRRQVADQIRGGRLKLLYLSPERLMMEHTLTFLREVPVSFFAIDEAHCISDWGHDFRPEYRALRALRERFPGTAVHAYTATATGRVREDITRELELRQPQTLVGSFDRPNLVYRVQRRKELRRQIRGVIDRYPNDSGIIYCIRRADVESTCADLTADGYTALPYHAGLADKVRHENQEAFLADRARIIVATVAFGMGIDKSNVRYVIHAGAPKSIENYQQESGRAGRDGLEAECCLFYSPADFATWRKLQNTLQGQAATAANALLTAVEGYCTHVNCRHRAIVTYFGQQLDAPSCDACDVCWREVELVAEPLVVAQKIISCVLRLKESFGADHAARVLVGSREERVLARAHERLSTWGILREHSQQDVRSWIEQLVAQGYLIKGGDYNVLQVTPCGWQVLRGQGEPRLGQPAQRAQRTAKVAASSWEGVDRPLFERLRAWRRTRAEQRGLPPFVVFGDATLRDLARKRPTTLEALLAVHGIGQHKRDEYGTELLGEIASHFRETAAGGALDKHRDAKGPSRPALGQMNLD